MQSKKTKSHTSTRKKASISKSTPCRTQKASAKGLKLTAKSKEAIKKEERVQLKRDKKLEELTLKMFRQVYEDYQQGKFHRIL